MHKPDGLEPLNAGGDRTPHFNWGWLSSEHPFPTGWVDQTLKATFLIALGQVPVSRLMRGWHDDVGLGLHRDKTPDPRNSWDRTGYSNGERVVEHQGVVYAAPAVALYFVRDLDYLPPSEVVLAVINGVPVGDPPRPPRPALTGPDQYHERPR